MLMRRLLQDFTATATALGIIFGAGYAIGGDSIIPATRAYVNGPLRDVQIDVANGKIDALDGQRTMLQIEALKTNDPDVKAKTEGAIRRIDRSIDAITDQLKVLRAGK